MRNRPEALMVFAAGFGRRMGALTLSRPKPLIEVAGRTLLDHALDLAAGQGLRRIAVNAHYLADQIEAHLAMRAGVRVLREEPDILETGGGLKAALGVLGPGPVFTLNSDAVWSGPNPLETLRAAWRPGSMGALLLLVAADQATGHDGPGDFRLAADGRLERGGPYVYTGAQIIDGADCARIDGRVFSLNRVWDRLDAEGRLYGVVHRGGWADVGRPEGIAAAGQLVAARPDVRA